MAPSLASPAAYLFQNDCLITSPRPRVGGRQTGIFYNPVENMVAYAKIAPRHCRLQPHSCRWHASCCISVHAAGLCLIPAEPKRRNDLKKLTILLMFVIAVVVIAFNTTPDDLAAIEATVNDVLGGADKAEDGSDDAAG